MRQFFWREKTSVFKDKKILVRLVLFIFVLSVAIYAFANGLLQFNHRDNGYYDIEPTMEGKAVLYGSGLHLKYYLEGSSTEIRQQSSEIQDVYTDIQLRYYKLLDAEQTYEGYINLASLNEAPGKTLTLDPALTAVLKDALARTERGEGYSVFSGALHKEWQGLRYLENPVERDPVNSREEARLLAAIAAAVNQEGAVSLILDANGNQATLLVSEEYSQFVAREGIQAPVLDLNLLHDAYLLQLTARDLAVRGYTQGYLYTDSGLSVMLYQSGTTAYSLIGAAGVLGEIQLDSPSAFCQFTAFSAADGLYGHYTVKTESATYYRHPYIALATGDYKNVLMTCYLGGSDEDLIDMAYEAVVMNQLSSPASVWGRAASLPEEWFFAYTLQGEEGVLHAPGGSAERVTLEEDSGYALSTGI